MSRHKKIKAGLAIFIITIAVLFALIIDELHQSESIRTSECIAYYMVALALDFSTAGLIATFARICK